MHAANQATVPSVRWRGQEIPLFLLVCGRSATGARGSVDGGAEDTAGEGGPAEEAAGEDDPALEPGDAAGDGPAEEPDGRGEAGPVRSSRGEPGEAGPG